MARHWGGGQGYKIHKMYLLLFSGARNFFFRFVDIVLIKIKDGISAVFLILCNLLILHALYWWS